MREAGVPNGVSGVGYGEADLDALTRGVDRAEAPRRQRADARGRGRDAGALPRRALVLVRPCMPDDPRAPTRAAYPHFLPIATRWMDNDVYGHVNNVVYYAYFDTVINRYLIEEGGLDIAGGDAIGLCVESHCAYLRPIAFPDDVDAGLRVAHLGRSSVRYEIGIFAQGERRAVGPRVVRPRLRRPRDAAARAAARRRSAPRSSG